MRTTTYYRARTAVRFIFWSTVYFLTVFTLSWISQLWEK